MSPHFSGNGAQPHALSFLKAGCLWFTLSWSFYFRSHAVLNCPSPRKGQSSVSWKTSMAAVTVRQGHAIAHITSRVHHPHPQGLGTSTQLPLLGNINSRTYMKEMFP